MTVTPEVGEFPGPVAAWLGPSVMSEPTLACGIRFLHSGLLRDSRFHNSIRQSFSSSISPATSCYFPDCSRCIVTLGFSSELRESEQILEALGSLWLERAAASAERARTVLDEWVDRQFQYDDAGRPYGIRFFTRVREAALFGGDISLAARPAEMAARVRYLIETSAHEVISRLIRGPRVLLSSRGGSHEPR